MPYQRTIEPRDSAAAPQCIHFRSKAMCVTGELRPRDPDEKHNHDQNCWCNMTQHVLGPDRSLVQLDVCVGGRECFRAS